MQRLEDAKKSLDDGARFESEGDLAKAKAAYVQSAQWFSFVIKYQTNERLKPMLREHMAKAISAAERMQQSIDGAASAALQGYPASVAAQPQVAGVGIEPDPLMESLRGTIQTEKPNIEWEDVAGLEQAKTILRDATEFPAQFPHLFSQGELKPWKGVLLYGPPGTGKTYLAKAVATSSGSDSSFFSISSADLVSKWVGESAKLVKCLFTLARTKAPAVVFIDEIDSLVSDRSGSSGKSESSSQLLAEFLAQMDGCGPSTEGVTIIAATNLPWALDRAVLSRLQKKVYVELPERKHRAEQIRIRLKKDRTILTPEDIDNIAAKTERYSGRDLSALVQSALAECVQEFKLATTWRRFEPHPFKEELQFAYEPVWGGNWEIPARQLQGKTLDASIGMDNRAVCQNADVAKRTVLPPVQLRHFDGALKRFKPTVSEEDLVQFHEWTEKYGTSAY